MKKHESSEKALLQKFGRLLVIEILNEKTDYGHRIVKCLCDCGQEKIVPLNRVKTSNVSSCGCLKKELLLKMSKLSVTKGIKSGRIKDPRIGSAMRVYKKTYADGDLSFEQFMNLSQKNCHYCGAVPFNNSNCYAAKNNKCTKDRKVRGNFIYSGLDRVDSSLPHNLDNVIPCCVHCNKAKLDRSSHDFFLWVKQIYDLHFVSA